MSGTTFQVTSFHKKVEQLLKNKKNKIFFIF